MPNIQQKAVKRYSSRFIVDVTIEPNRIALID